MTEALAKPWGELALYHDFAQKMSEGLLPYKDFYPEYPPLSLLFFRSPLIFGTRYYMLSYYVLVALAVVLTAFLIKKLSGKPFAFIAAILPLGGLFWDRFDIFPAFISILAVTYLVKNKTKLAHCALSLGVLTKIYPALLLPVFFARTFYYKGFRKALGGLIIFLIPIVVALWIICGYGGKEGLIKFAEFQGKRGLHLESIRATIPLVQHLQGTRTFETIFEHNTFELKEVSNENINQILEVTGESDPAPTGTPKLREEYHSGEASYYDNSYCEKHSLDCITASGEIFNEDLFTCACIDYYSLGTDLKFTYQNKSVVARCNDRGSFEEKYSRVADLSKVAFEALAPLSEGIIKVEVEEIESE